MSMHVLCICVKERKGHAMNCRKNARTYAFFLKMKLHMQLIPQAGIT